MPTDTARVRRTDPGEPTKCPVWQLHKIYSSEETKSWVEEGCRSAGIGCIDCKKPLIDAVIAEQEPIHKRAVEFIKNPDLVRSIVSEGCEAARTIARETIKEVRTVMGIED